MALIAVNNRQLALIRLAVMDVTKMRHAHAEALASDGYRMADGTRPTLDNILLARQNAEEYDRLSYLVRNVVEDRTEETE